MLRWRQRRKSAVLPVGAQTGETTRVVKVDIDLSLLAISSNRNPVLQITEVPVSVRDESLSRGRFGTLRDSCHILKRARLLLIGCSSLGFVEPVCLDGPRSKT